MKNFCRITKSLVLVMAFSLILLGCTSQKVEDIQDTKVSQKEEKPELKEEQTDEEKEEQEVKPEENSETNNEDEDSIYSDHSQMKFGKFTLNGISENNAMVTLVVEEKAFVTPKDKKLIKQFGLPEDLNGYDYEIVDIAEPELICAFKWDCTCIMFDYGKMEASKTDWDTFGDHMIDMDYSQYDEESGEYILDDGAMRSIWAYYTVDEDGFMTSIEEIYIP